MLSLKEEAHATLTGNICTWSQPTLCDTMLLAFTYYYVQKDCISYFVTTVDSIWGKSVSCWILNGCNVPLPVANTQTVATVLNMEQYEKMFSHTKIKIKNNKEKM